MENLMDRMIAVYGYENPITIEFCMLCEKGVFTSEVLETIVQAHEENPVF